MIAIKPICENVGLKWHGQFERIKRDSVIRVMRTTATDGKTYEFTCLPLDYLNGWLFGIDDKHIKNPEVRQRIRQYKRECYRALANYWLHGQELALLFDAQQQPLVAMKPICENIGLIWDAQYRRVQRDEMLNSVVVMMARPKQSYYTTCRVTGCND